VDAVYSRQCITFVLHSLLGKMLGEKQQAAACKELARIINHQMNSIGINSDERVPFENNNFLCVQVIYF